MFILKKGHQPGVYVPLRALFLVLFCSKVDYGCTHNLFLSQVKQQQNNHNFHVKIVIYKVLKIQAFRY